MTWQDRVPVLLIALLYLIVPVLMWAIFDALFGR